MNGMTRRVILSAAVAAGLGLAGGGGVVRWAAAADQPAANTADAPGKPAAVDVPVKAVVLFSSGVGYFEHFGTVDGSGSAELRFKTQQINDILKSLILQDLDGGKVTTITYPSQDPIAKTLRSFQVDITSNPSLGDLLNQLRGAKVKATVGSDNVDGTILGLEKKQKPAGEKGTVEVWVLNLMSGATIRSVELEQVTRLELEDKQLQEELGKALLALSQARDQDKKPVTLNFTGEGKRHVRLGYVVETPVWKTSYRLVLGEGNKAEGDEAKGKEGKGGVIQGWAIVENQTDNDWNEVQLSLVSGRPISFIQDLYRPLYVPRPVVQPKLYASLNPQTYEGGLEENKKLEDFAKKDEAERGLELEQVMRKTSGLAAGSRGRRDAAKQLAANSTLETAAVADATVLERPFDPMASVASVASAAKAGELFQYTVGSVSLPRQRSAMIPIVTDSIESERLSIYNPNVLARNPLNGARLKNTTGKHLLAGPVTVLDSNGNTTSYAGDASIDDLPPGQERLLSYGIDLQVLVDATKNKSDSTITAGKIIKGVLQLKRKHVFRQEYRAENKGDHDKTLIIEHPLRGRWKLAQAKDEPQPFETTPTLYRFRGHVAPGKATQVSVTEEMVQGEAIVLLPTDPAQLALYVKNGQISQDVRDALGQAAQLKRALTTTQRQVQDREQKVAQITTEQSRLRENIKTVSGQSEYSTRLLKKLNDQETRLEALQTEIDELKKKQEEQRKALEDYLKGLNVG